ncbi:MAG: NAD-dependent epimerase/dehydratase family protein [Candidatus Hydrogenedentes bacterium]|nr:NAD-dependent epimerase/dehydratase family protein [Candidatus Hydrogenedentota bacterium]
MAKILVTGGAGFIGSHVADVYLAAGHEVVIADNLSSGARRNVPAQAMFYEVDIRSGELQNLLAQERPEIVNHLAAQIDVRKSLQDPKYDADTNILGSINLLEACVKQGVRKFLFASTGGAIYGEPEHLPASEQTPSAPLSHYGVSKYCVEQYIRLYSRMYGLSYTILRFPNVYGPRQSPHGEAGVCSILAGKMLQGETPVLYGYGAPLRDYVYVGDIAQGALLALEKGDGEILNLGSGRGASVRELFDILKEFTGFQGEPALAPLRPGEVERIYTTGGRAREVLGWSPRTDLREGLRLTLEFIRAHP